MTIKATSIVKPQQNNSNNYTLAAVLGGAAGAGARYILPLKNEAKNSGDCFISTAKMSARAANRSILKYGALGALAGLAINALRNAFSPKDDTEKEKVEYSKYGALLDAPDYACEIMWYND